MQTILEIDILTTGKGQFGPQLENCEPKVKNGLCLL